MTRRRPALPERPDETSGPYDRWTWWRPLQHAQRGLESLLIVRCNRRGWSPPEETGVHGMVDVGTHDGQHWEFPGPYGTASHRVGSKQKKLFKTRADCERALAMQALENS